MDVYELSLSPGQLGSYGLVWLETYQDDSDQSVLDGIQRGWNDNTSGDWLLHYGFNRDPQLIGRIPKSFFTTLVGDKAADIWFAGMAEINVTLQPTPALAPMGSGYMASGNANMEASMSNIELIDERG
uniref:Neprosin PEP catalytic domain-containing protein n=1 Tax=Leersia perrieri TaxID=77586 RepID=A0A0D9WTD9_9ORYZ